MGSGVEPRPSHGRQNPPAEVRVDDNGLSPCHGWPYDEVSVCPVTRNESKINRSRKSAAEHPQDVADPLGSQLLGNENRS